MSPSADRPPGWRPRCCRACCSWAAATWRQAIRCCWWRFANAGRLAIFLPATVVEAMLAAIGIIIIVKQIPALLGAAAPATKNVLASISLLPQSLQTLDTGIAFIGVLCLFLMFYLNRIPFAWLRRVPVPLVVAGIGIGLGYALQLDPRHLIRIPDDILKGGITLPAFDEVWQRKELWGSLLVVVITLTLIDGIESLATIAAVDKIDPFQRKSDADVTLRAMGISNSLSSIFGGLTIIPGGVKSRVNIDAGGRTLWANFYNAIFLIIFLFVAADLIGRVPLATIAAILIYVGWRLCEFRVFNRTFSIGRDQILIFIFTILAILATDLLWGIIAGVAAEVLMLLYLLHPSLRTVLTGRLTFSQSFAYLGHNLSSLFRSPVISVREETIDGKPHVRISLGSVVCFNLIFLDNLLQSLPADASLTLVMTESGHVIDHSAMEFLHQIEEEYVRQGRKFELLGMDGYYQFTSHALSARMSNIKLTQEKARLSQRAQMLQDFAGRLGMEFSSSLSGMLDPWNFIYLRRGADKSETNTMQGTRSGLNIKFFDYSHTAAPDYYVEHRHTLLVVSLPEGRTSFPKAVITPGAYLERYLVGMNETPCEGACAEYQYRLFTAGEAQDALAFAKALAPVLQTGLRLYVESQGDAVLAFYQDRELLNPEEIERLLALVDCLADAET
jgi:carbonic anhydrase